MRPIFSSSFYEKCFFPFLWCNESFTSMKRVYTKREFWNDEKWHPLGVYAENRDVVILRSINLSFLTKEPSFFKIKKDKILQYWTSSWKPFLRTFSSSKKMVLLCVQIKFQLNMCSKQFNCTMWNNSLASYIRCYQLFLVDV